MSLTRAARWRRLASDNPALIAALAYAALSLGGAALLMMPISRDAVRSDSVGFLDALFVSTSAVSTTGLVTVDPGSTFSFFGELVVLLLIQIGGVGYMTFMSFAYLMLRNKLSPLQADLTRTGFGLTRDYSMRRFVLSVVIATALIEAIGAAALAYHFALAGTSNPIWDGVFHSVSAFCTAGFSLFPTSLEAFKGDRAVLYIVAALSYLGAMGFIVISEVVDVLTRPRASLSPTTRLIFSVTAGLAAIGTLFLWIFDPTIAALPFEQRFDNAFFQAMTASTTVGFNSVPIGALAPASIMIMYLLMFVGASPSGTGGGIKSTTAALLIAAAVASVSGKARVTSAGVTVPAERVQQAMATLIIGLSVIFIAVVLLDLTGTYDFEKALFEVFSALGTVGLSMGITAELNAVGKAIITATMYIGRVGVLAFFLAFAIRVDHGNRPPPERDVII